MGWVALPIAALMLWMGIDVASPIGVGLAVVLGALTAPPLWKAVKARGYGTQPGFRWTVAIMAGFGAFAANATTYSETPEGKAAEAERVAEKKARDDSLVVETVANANEKQRRIASGEHCLSSWDGSFPALKDAVKRQLRNPRSFEYVETVRSPVDDKGTFGLIMTYRAENGFGGMNVDAIGVEVNAKTCRFKRATNESLARRLEAAGA